MVFHLAATGRPFGRRRPRPPPAANTRTDRVVSRPLSPSLTTQILLLQVRLRDDPPRAPVRATQRDAEYTARACVESQRKHCSPPPNSSSFARPLPRRAPRRPRYSRACDQFGRSAPPRRRARIHGMCCLCGAPEGCPRPAAKRRAKEEGRAQPSPARPLPSRPPTLLCVDRTA